MICIYEANATDFSSNGAGSLSPSSCTVSETLNGEYEVTLEHPLDEQGKWRRLQEECILRVPVPAAMTPRVRQMTQSSSTDIYKVSTYHDPLRLRSGTGTKYKVIAKYKKGTEVIVLEKTTDSWYEVSCPDGKRGYMSAKYLTFVRTESDPATATGEIIESRQLRDQPFRIYRVVPDLDKVTVYARHIFYDLIDNMIQSYKPSSSAVGASVVQGISENAQSEHDFTFYSDLTSTAEDVEYVNVNPVEAILGEGGLTEKYGGELARDWFDVYLVERVGQDTDVQIREGKNLLGVSYDVDITDVVTRIMPTGETEDGDLLYLPELFIDSPLVGNYTHPKWIHLPVSEAKVVKDGDDKKTKDECYEAMRSAVQAEYDKGCDMPTVTLNVDFINCAETEEYKQYHLLQNIYLGDSVRVIAPRIGLEVSMRMTQYAYDCLQKQYTAMTLGTIADTMEATVITSRQLPAGSITGSKLAMNSVGGLQIQTDAIQANHIASEAITAEKIAAGTITAEKLAAGVISAGSLEAITAHIESLTASSIETDRLAAAIASFTVITAGTATFDRATVEHLVAEALNLSFGVGDEVFINNLKVVYAQVVSATIGNLCIKASDGNYYTIDVDAEGNVSATKTTVTEGEISAGQTDAGRVILGTDIVAQDLSASNLLATYALVNKIDAARIDVDQLFAREAFITALTTSQIFGGKSLSMIVSNVNDSITAVDVEYGLSSSSTMEPVSNAWSTTAPAVTEGSYLWTRTKTVTVNGSYVYSDPICLTGAQGKDGVSITGVYNLYLATSLSSGVTTSTSGWTADVSTLNLSATNKYLWNYEIVTMSDGSADQSAPTIIGVYGDTGDKGDKGDAGRGISYIAEYYQRSASASSAPSGTWYTSATNTNVQTSAEIPYLWSYERIFYTDGTYEDSTKRVIGVHGSNGASGVGITNVQERYYKTTDPDTTPGNTDTAWSTTLPTWESGVYFWTQIVVTYSDGTVEYTTPQLDTSWQGVEDLIDESANIAHEAQNMADLAYLEAQNAMTRLDFERIVREEVDGLHIGDNTTTSEVVIDSVSVNIKVNNETYSTFGPNFLQLGDDIRMRTPACGGIAFSPVTQ